LIQEYIDTALYSYSDIELYRRKKGCCQGPPVEKTFPRPMAHFTRIWFASENEEYQLNCYITHHRCTARRRSPFALHRGIEHGSIGMLSLPYFEHAKAAASGWDVYWLEQEWRGWIAKKERPETPGRPSLPSAAKSKKTLKGWLYKPTGVPRINGKS
jgi:hypothetical protein